MLRYLLVLALALLILGTVSAFTLQAPDSIEIHDSTSFTIEITNTTNTQKELKINFFTPFEVEILSPKSIPPYAKSTAKITLNYSSKTYTEITSKLEVYLDNDLEEREITLRFFSNQANQNNNIINDQSEEYMGALFGLGAIVELANFSMLEWALFIVLVIIAAILLITLVARAIKVRNRV